MKSEILFCMAVQITKNVHTIFRLGCLMVFKRTYGFMNLVLTVKKKKKTGSTLCDCATA